MLFFFVSPDSKNQKKDLRIGNFRPFHGSPNSEDKDGAGSLPSINTIAMIGKKLLLHVLEMAAIYQLTMLEVSFISCSQCGHAATTRNVLVKVYYIS